MVVRLGGTTPPKKFGVGVVLNVTREGENTTVEAVFPNVGPTERILKRGENKPVAVQCAENDTLVEELEEFAAAARGQGKHEVGGVYATISLAVVRAGILSALEGRRVEVAEILDRH